MQSKPTGQATARPPMPGRVRRPASATSPAAIARLCGAAAIAGILLAGLARRHAPAPGTLEKCMDRPRQGYATPALERRVRLCAPLVAYGEPDPASGLAAPRGVDTPRAQH